MTRVAPVPERFHHPLDAGLCKFCRRQMWTNFNDGKSPGVLRASSTRPGVCATCSLALDRHPDRDPRDSQGAAERIPAEAPEADTSWRPHSACLDSPPELFFPDLDPDEAPMEDDAARRLVLTQRRQTARAFCANCPVLEECQNTADAHGFEGLWGGRFYTRTQWHSLLGDGAKGLTMFSKRIRSERRAARDAAARAAMEGAA
jgi:hypothetical protein